MKHVLSMTYPMKSIASIILAMASFVLCSTVSAATWSFDGSALYFTEDSQIGAGLGIGARTGNHYIGADMVIYENSETYQESGFTAKATATIVGTGVAYKYFVPIVPTKKIDLYFGGGAGWGIVKIEATASGFGQSQTVGDRSTNNFAHQFMAGVQIPLGESKGSVKFGWRYVNVDKVELAGVSDLKFDSHVIELGFNLAF